MLILARHLKKHLYIYKIILGIFKKMIILNFHFIINIRNCAWLKINIKYRYLILIQTINVLLTRMSMINKKYITNCIWKIFNYTCELKKIF